MPTGCEMLTLFALTRQALMAAVEEAQKLGEEAAAATHLREELRRSEDKIATCLELLGERNERVEQMELDIREMKGAYKEQISILASQVAMLSSKP
eukprot:4270278-Pyramimonas_sp.AAC.1